MNFNELFEQVMAEGNMMSPRAKREEQSAGDDKGSAPGHFVKVDGKWVRCKDRAAAQAKLKLPVGKPLIGNPNYEYRR